MVASAGGGVEVRGRHLTTALASAATRAVTKACPWAITTAIAYDSALGAERRREFQYWHVRCMCRYQTINLFVMNKHDPKLVGKHVQDIAG